MAGRPRHRTAPSVAQTRLKELEARLAQIEKQLKALRTETAGSVGAARVELRQLERRAAGQIAGAQRAFKQSLDSISRTLATSRENVGDKASRLTRAVRAGVRAGSLAYRRSRG